MHILVLPSWYPTPGDPIRGSFFAEQAEALSRYGHKVSVIALEKDAESGIRTADDITSLIAAGASGFLIGETLMRAPHPGTALRQLTNI